MILGRASGSVTMLIVLGFVTPYHTLHMCSAVPVDVNSERLGAYVQILLLK